MPNLLLTICIPTYKRHITLRRCIDSVISQIEKFGLSACVSLYVANDASPDDTVSVLNAYASLDYFAFTTREANIGMNANIKCMLKETARNSHYQLIVTDDDYLQPDVLGEVVSFLLQERAGSKQMPAIWTPRYSYLEDGRSHCVVCRPFETSTFVVASPANAGRYMENGFVLSGLILRSECVDFEFWERYKENAYFPIVFFGDLLFRYGGYFWSKNIVHHTVLNECHWERWGKNDVTIRLRLFADYVNAYGVIAERINARAGAMQFYLAAFTSIYRVVGDLLRSEELNADRLMVSGAIHELKESGVMVFKAPLHQLMVWALLLSVTISAGKSLILRILSLLDRRGAKRKSYLERSKTHLGLLRTSPIVLRLIT